MIHIFSQISQNTSLFYTCTAQPGREVMKKIMFHASDCKISTAHKYYSKTYISCLKHLDVVIILLMNVNIYEQDKFDTQAS